MRQDSAEINIHAAPTEYDCGYRYTILAEARSGGSIATDI